MIGVFAPANRDIGSVTSLLVSWKAEIVHPDTVNVARANVLLFSNLMDLIDGPVPDGGDLPSPPIVQPGVMIWQEVQAPRRPGWWLVLANLFESTLEAPARITVGTTDDRNYSAIPATYEGLERELEFEFEDSSEGTDLAISVEFARPIDPAHVEAIEDRLDTWIAISMIGGFRDPADDPEESGFAPGDDVEYEDLGLSFSVKRFTANEIAIDALLAMLGTLANEGLPVRRVDIR